jgi:regulatory protein
MSGPDGPFRSAEEWLEQQGVRREPIAAPPPAVESQPGPDPSAREVARLAEAQARDAAAGLAPPPPLDPADAPDAADPDARTPPQHRNLEDEVARALNFIRRSTANQPASEGRLRRKLADRDTPAPAIDQALRRARDERLVDDTALARALVEERRAKGHANKRIRMDLRKRELSDDVIEAAIARYDVEDPEAVAFDVARRRADTYGALEPEKAFRRLVGYLARRGHSEHVARKVAREVIYVEREQERAAGH